MKIYKGYKELPERKTALLDDSEICFYKTKEEALSSCVKAVERVISMLNNNMFIWLPEEIKNHKHFKVLSHQYGACVTTEEGSLEYDDQDLWCFEIVEYELKD